MNKEEIKILFIGENEKVLWKGDPAVSIHEYVETLLKDKKLKKYTRKILVMKGNKEGGFTT